MTSHLLPGESIISTFTAGDLVWYVRTPRGGYGFSERVPGVVVRVGKRVLIETSAHLSWVSPMSLRRRDQW